jgi:glycine betaine/proline transport system substrate-binding protein
VGNNEFIAANPAIKTLIDQIKFPVATWSSWEFAISKNGGSSTLITKLAGGMVTTDKPQFDQWVAAESKVH